MKRNLIIAVLGSPGLAAGFGATVFRDDIADAAGSSPAVSTATSVAVPVREQNLDGANIRVHEEGTPHVSVSGTPTVNVAGTPTVSVAGTPTVSVAGTPTVSVAGTPTVNVAGTVATVAASPANAFSLSVIGTSVGFVPLDGCTDNLPAGTRWFITTFAVTPQGTTDESARLIIAGSQGQSFRSFGPWVSTQSTETEQLAFPEGFEMTSTVAGDCLALDSVPDARVMVIGYREAP